MIQLPDVKPDQRILNSLQEWQDVVNGQTGFEEQSALAKTSFSQKNKKGNHTFDEVKKVLTQMCSGARRCVYCEDSVADEVEHIYPKDLYPEKLLTGITTYTPVGIVMGLRIINLPFSEAIPKSFRP